MATERGQPDPTHTQRQHNREQPRRLPQKHHPYWSGEELRPSRLRSWAAPFLLGLAYDLRLVQAARDAENAWLVRLSPIGRWLLGVAKAPQLEPLHVQTLLVQPNLEIIAY